MTKLSFASTETQIAHAVIDALLAAGYSVCVMDGEEIVTDRLRDATLIAKALRSTDEDYLFVYAHGNRVGWVRLIWGNEVDVISDYTVSLTGTLAPIFDAINAMND